MKVLKMKVLVFGSLNYDYVYQMDHIVIPGETQSSYSMEVCLGGKGFNQAVALSKAGLDVYLAGSIGEDGEAFIEACQQYGICYDDIKHEAGKTGHAIIQVDKHSQNCIVLYGGANQLQTPKHIQEVLSHFEKGDILVLQNEINHLDTIVNIANEKQLTIVLNPSPYNEKLKAIDFNKISMFILNEVEGEAMTNSIDPQTILDRIHEMYPQAEVVLTLGEQGAYHQTKDGIKTYQPAFKVNAVDTTAAGDTFTGYFISGMSEHLPIQDCLKQSAYASSKAVQILGAANSIPLKAELIKELQAEQ